MSAVFTFNIVTPEGKKFSHGADLLTLNTTLGKIGIMKGHAPIDAIVDVCELKYHLFIDGHITENYIALGGGILHITKNEVIILADSFEHKKEIDVNRAENAKIRAEKRLENKKDENIDIRRAEIALKKALNRIKIGSR